MPSVLPDGDPAPSDGSLPESAYDDLGRRPFGIYLHVPFCASRCGYCDFNTYTPAELGGAVTTGDWLIGVRAELDLATRVLGERRPEVATVFVGGGTPTLLGPERLAAALDAIRERFRLAPEVEVTTEANPESVDLQALDLLRRSGFTRVSFGVQSTSERVLADLDRQHTPGRALAAVGEAVNAGFEHVSADLIYGAASETDDDWRASLEAVAGSGVDHVSAYSLIVEPGTRLAARVARGEVPMPDDDVLAGRYLIAEEVLTAHGFTAYEVSNWTRSDAGRCRHNLGYWTGGDWWGIGPGAHSHVGGVRWWNVKHPAAWSARLAAGESPAYAREVLTDDEQRMEQVLLRLRLADGLPVALLSEVGRKAAGQAAADGLLDADALSDDGRAVLTVRGRLLADAVVRDLVD